MASAERTEHLKWATWSCTRVAPIGLEALGYQRVADGLRRTGEHIFSVDPSHDAITTLILLGHVATDVLPDDEDKQSAWSLARNIQLHRYFYMVAKCHLYMGPVDEICAEVVAGGWHLGTEHEAAITWAARGWPGTFASLMAVADTCRA